MAWPSRWEAPSNPFSCFLPRRHQNVAELTNSLLGFSFSVASFYKTQLALLFSIHQYTSCTALLQSFCLHCRPVFCCAAVNESICAISTGAVKSPITGKTGAYELRKLDAQQAGWCHVAFSSWTKAEYALCSFKVFGSIVTVKVSARCLCKQLRGTTDSKFNTDFSGCALLLQCDVLENQQKWCLKWSLAKIKLYVKPRLSKDILPV